MDVWLDDWMYGCIFVSGCDGCMG